MLAVPKLLLSYRDAFLICFLALAAAAMLKMSYELLGMYSYQPARALQAGAKLRRSCS